jgi:parallel beta-helix repeat protein
MFPPSPWCISCKKFISVALIALGSAIMCHSATVDIRPGDDIPSIVAANPAGTTFIIYPGTYRLTEHIVPKTGDSFNGETACAPPTTSCPAIISGSTVIGPLAVLDGTVYKVTGQTQQNPIAPQNGAEIICDTAWPGCIYPEDLYFDGVPYQHLKSSTLPVIGTHQWWFDYTNHIIYFHDNPSGHLVETSVLDNAFGGSANNVTIKYLTVKEFAAIYPNGAIGQGLGNDVLTEGVNWTVQNCEILVNHGWGVRVLYRMSVLDNYIHDNGETGIGGGMGITTDPVTQATNAEILIQGNIINHNDYAHFNPDFGAGGIKVGATSGITVRGNTIQYNEGSGVHFDDNSQGELLDGNIITDNTDSDGVNQEMGAGTLTSTFRNNYVARNGTQINDAYFTGQLTVHASPGIASYCNVIETQAGPGVNGWVITAADRGDSLFPPYEYLVTTGNSFHHNTLIWDAGATGGTGWWQDDAAHQPDYFEDNQRPDYNTYHLSNSTPLFIYDNNDTEKNGRKTFAEYQAADGDVHGSADTNYTSGFPTVAITSPLDQTSFTDSVTVEATASDKSGIERVEFYVDWALEETVSAAPYNFDWTNATTGTHIVAAMAYSNKGIRNCYAVTLTKLTRETSVLPITRTLR